ncbi:MAG: TetR/AcrR family transcriptional regulator [Pygmaiobacter sp.]|nr:TetR/AcrR family transcriptional regulator [Pygmaiobacter sp.]
MPKSFTPQERSYIVQRLQKEAAACLAQYGVRHTTVDELVRRAGIPKGTFYLFYRSKEQLLFEVLLQLHEQMQAQMQTALASLDPATVGPDELADLLFQFFMQAQQQPILRLLNSDEVELLARKLPPEVVANHVQDDSELVAVLMQQLPGARGKDAQVFSAALHQIYFATLHKEEIDATHYEAALRLLIRGVVLQLLQ